MQDFRMDDLVALARGLEGQDGVLDPVKHWRTFRVLTSFAVGRPLLLNDELGVVAKVSLELGAEGGGVRIEVAIECREAGGLLGDLAVNGREGLPGPHRD